MEFREVDRRYAELNRQYANGDLSDEAFDTQLVQMMVQDDKDRWWAKSRETGDWHYYDGSAWVRGTPSEPPAREPPPAQLPVQSPQATPPPVQNSGQRGGRARRPVIIGVLSAVATLVVLVVVIALLGSGSTDFVIRDRLGSEQVNEAVVVSVDGKDVGNLYVDRDNPTDELEVSLDDPGTHNYTMGLSATMENSSGRQSEASASGGGTIDVRDGKVFAIGLTGSGRNLEVSLEEEAP